MEILKGVESGYHAIERWIRINKLIAGWMRTNVLLHETAHYLAGHNSTNNTLRNRADVEVTAEGTAAIVMKILGTDTAGYSHPKIAGIIIQERSAFTNVRTEVFLVILLISRRSQLGF